MDAPVVEQPVVEQPVQEPVEADPFALDEARLVSLSPEQRAALDPVFQEWKTKAKGELDKASKTYQEKSKPFEEKAKALDELVRDQRFVSWWQNMQRAATAQNPTAEADIKGTKPEDFATSEEWQQAIYNASVGDGQKLKEIQQRMFSVMATPVIQEIRSSQKELKTTLEMKDLFERHNDAKDLDAIGRTDGQESLLEACLNWAEKNHKPLEEGYQRARRWADALKVGAKQEAMGLVQEKKASITSGPSTTKPGVAVVEVADSDELMQKNMEYILNGQTPPKFVIRNSVSSNRDRWTQKT